MSKEKGSMKNLSSGGNQTIIYYLALVYTSTPPDLRLNPTFVSNGLWILYSLVDLLLPIRSLWIETPLAMLDGWDLSHMSVSWGWEEMRTWRFKAVYSITQIEGISEEKPQQVRIQTTHLLWHLLLTYLFLLHIWFLNFIGTSCSACLVHYLWFYH